ncbi:MAG: TonB-dependent receptor [Verrucomicrobiales bacterium]|nr:TonB-dependent receptor [Verrucomicrobiales bacterium]
MFLAPFITLAADPAPGASPEANPGLSLSDLSLSELLEVRYDSVYGASKRTQKTWQAPASVTVVNRQDIQTFGYRTLADALESTPGTYVTSDRDYSYLGVRGFSPPGDYNGRVLLLIDGHRANDNIYDSALLGTEGLLDIDLVERIEVIRGPASSLYGSSAFFGILNVIPRRGGDLQGAEFSAEAGSDETYKARATTGYKLDSGVEFLLSATYFESDGEAAIRLPYHDTPGSPPAIARDLDGFHGHNLHATVSYHDLSLTASTSARDKTIPDAGAGSTFGDPRGANTDASTWLDLKLDHRFENDARLLARLGYHQMTYLGWYPYDTAAPGDPPDLLLNRDDVHGAWWGTEVSYEHTLFEKLILTGGVEFRHNFQQDQQNFDEGLVEDVFGDVRDESTSLGVFGQADWTVHERLIASAGLRYDDSSTADGHLSPRLGLIGRPWDSTTLKLLYGSAFRAPNAYEYGFVASYFEGNPQLDPEVVQSFELNAEQELVTPSLTATASLFYNRVEDLVVYEENAGIGTFRNADANHAYGAELGLEYRWPSRGLLRASYSAQHAENIESGQRLFNAPEHLARLQARIPLWRDRIHLSPEIRYVDSSLGNQGRIDGYWTTQITLFTRELLPGLEASATVYNLFNETIDHPISTEYIGNAMPQPGRTFRFKLTYRF